MDNYERAYKDLYQAEEKNPTKRRSKAEIFLSILLPIIVLGLIALLVFQFYTLSKVGEVVAEKPDPVVTPADDGA